MRVLFVSAPHPEASWLYKALQESAHSLQRAEDLRDGAFLAAQEAFDAIVVMVHEPSSYPALLEILPAFSASGGTAIIVLLGPASAQDRTRALRAGADACFGHPYSFIEMHERMQALQRTAVARVPQEAPKEAAGASLDASTRELAYGERRVGVTRREYLLLECLLRHLNAPVPRDQLIRYAWPEKEDVDPSSVNLVVARLRRKLAQKLPEVHIETVSRYGYQLSIEAA
jgi:two-component system, OmpR family, response regulator